MFMRRLVIVAVVAVVSSAAWADTIFVDDDNCPGPGSGTERDPYCSIQTAIDAAVDMDEIVVAPGTYFETITFLGKAITLRGSDGGGKRWDTARSRRCPTIRKLFSGRTAC